VARRKRPKPRVVDQPVFGGFVPATGDMVSQVAVIPDVVLPEALLPCRDFGLLQVGVHPDPFGGLGPISSGRHAVRVLVRESRGEPRPTQGNGKPGFDGAPPCREVGVPFGQSPNTVHVIRQVNPGIYGEGPFMTRGADSVSEGRDFAGQQIRSARGEGDWEEQRGAGAVGASRGVRYLGPSDLMRSRIWAQASATSSGDSAVAPLE
jgi:hypothetical protein